MNPLLLAFVLLSAPAASSASRSASPSGATPAPTSIADAAPAPGNANVLLSRVPELPQELRRRVGRYLESRSATFFDVSADGKRVLIGTRFASTTQLHVVEQPMGARFQLTFDEEPVADARFAPRDPNLLYYLQDAGGGEAFQVFRLDRRSGRAELLTDGRSRHENLILSREGSRLAYGSTRRNGKDTDVYLVEAASPRDAKLLFESAGTFLPLAFSPTADRLLLIQSRAIDDADLWLVELATGERRMLTPDPKREGKGSVREADFSADGRSVYFVSDRGSDFDELYRLDLSKPGARPVPLTRTIPWNVEALAVARDGSRVAFAVNADGVSRLHLLEPRTGRITPLDTPPGVIQGLAFAEARSDLLTFAMQSATGPGDIWQLDARSRKTVRWTRSEVGGVDASAFVAQELVRYPSTDGVSVPAFLYRAPKATFPGRRPVVVIWHGGPESQSRPTFSPLIQLLVSELGISVLTPNVRGSDGYGKRYLALDNGVKREASLADIGATLDWIATQPDLDPARIGVYGGSYGGFMVLSTLAFFPGRVKAGVDVVGISNLVSFLGSTKDYRRDLRRAEYGDERIPEVRAVQERVSPLNSVGRIQAALLVQQGKNDPRVAQSEAEQIVNALRNKGREVWYLLALNEGHGFKKKENRDLAVATAVFFLQRQLGDGPGASAR